MLTIVLLDFIEFVLELIDMTTNNVTTEILIIGGGITGASTAYFLAQVGHEVILFEHKPNSAGYICVALANSINDMLAVLAYFLYNIARGLNICLEGNHDKGVTMNQCIGKECHSHAMR